MYYIPYNHSSHRLPCQMEYYHYRLNNEILHWDHKNQPYQVVLHVVSNIKHFEKTRKEWKFWDITSFLISFSRLIFVSSFTFCWRRFTPAEKWSEMCQSANGLFTFGNIKQSQRIICIKSKLQLFHFIYLPYVNLSGFKLF